MKGGIRLGRVLGIELRLDWSLLLIFFLIVWSLSSGFSAVHSDWSATLTWGTAILGAILFLVSILIHEFAHSLVARTQGVPVSSITLFLFGGVSNIQREPPSPRAEFLITIVGPLSSLLLGVIFIALSGVPFSGMLSTTTGSSLDALRGLSPASSLLLWLGPINVLLGVFNLVPGFPLDGGRIMRSIFWASTDNLRKATRWASYLGQAVAWLMIGVGLAMAFGITVPFFGTGFINGLWLAFIGWFLHSAAASSYQQVVIRDILEGVPVSNMMRRDSTSVTSRITVRELVNEYFMRSDERSYPVVENGRLVGLVTLQDVRSTPQTEWDTKNVGQIMTAVDSLAVINEGADAADALQTLQEQDIGQLPVMRGTDLVGILRRRDIMRWLQIHSNAMRA